MYGLQGKLIATHGQRDALMALLLENTRGEPMPGLSGDGQRSAQK